MPRSDQGTAPRTGPGLISSGLFPAGRTSARPEERLTRRGHLCPGQGEQASRAISVCGEVLRSDPENVNALKDRAEAYLHDERYEDGMLQRS